MAEQIYNGSDLLLSVGGAAVGHCTTHTTTLNTETKERSFKPVASKAKQSGLWKGKGITGLSITISAEGLRAYDETEADFITLASQWGKGTTVEVLAFERSNDTDPYIQGQFVITSIEETAPAQDDTTYSIQLENDGEPDIYPGKEDTTDDTTTT